MGFDEMGSRRRTTSKSKVPRDIPKQLADAEAIAGKEQLASDDLAKFRSFFDQQTTTPSEMETTGAARASGEQQIAATLRSVISSVAEYATSSASDPANAGATSRVQGWSSLGALKNGQVRWLETSWRIFDIRDPMTFLLPLLVIAEVILVWACSSYFPQIKKAAFGLDDKTPNKNASVEVSSNHRRGELSSSLGGDTRGSRAELGTQSSMKEIEPKLDLLDQQLGEIKHHLDELRKQLRKSPPTE